MSSKSLKLTLIGAITWAVAGCGGGMGTPQDGGKGGSDGAGARDGGDATSDSSNPSDGGSGGSGGIKLSSLVVSGTTLMLAEGGEGTFTVGLSKALPDPITVTVSSGDRTVATTVTDTIRFDSGQTAPFPVLVQGVQDKDIVDNAAVITLSAPGLDSVTVRAEVKDIDHQSIEVLPSSALSVTEGDMSSLTVRLAFKPIGNVTVAVTSADPSRLTVVPASLTFTPANYDIPQAVALSALADADTESNNVSVTLTSAGVQNSPTVSVRIVDKDALNLSVVPSAVALTEGAAAGTFAVKLTRPPAANTTITIGPASSKLTITPATLTFTPANYATAQTVSVTANQDEDTKNEAVDLAVSATGIDPVTVKVTVADDDLLALQASPESLTVTEGASTTMTVRLAFDPGSAVTVRVIQSATGKVDVNPNVMIFDSTNYSAPQTVTVTGLQDDDLANESLNLTLTASGARNLVLPLAVTDDDVQALQVQYSGGPAPSPLVLQESPVAGTPSSAPISVRLAFRPAAPVTIDVMTSRVEVAAPSVTSLTFLPTNFSTPQIVMVRAPHDDNVDNDAATVTFSAVLGGPPSVAVPVSVLDRDVQNFIFLSGAAGMAEINALPAPTLIDPAPMGTPMLSYQFRVRLSSVPTNPVPVTITAVPGRSGGTITVSPPSGVIDSNNQSILVTVTGLDDADAADESSLITVSSSGIMSRSLTATVRDEDPQNLVVNKSNLTIGETTNPGDFTVRLNAQPLASVVVTLTPTTLNVANMAVSGGGGAMSSCLAASGAMSTPSCIVTFTPGDYGTPSPLLVSVTGFHDVNLVDSDTVIRVSAPGMSDQFVNVHVIDGDSQGLVLKAAPCGGESGPSPATGTDLDLGTIFEEAMHANHSRTFCVALARQPVTATTLTLTPAISLGGPFHTSPTGLTFSTTDYFTSLPVVVTADGDNDLLAPGMGVDGSIGVSVQPFAPSQNVRFKIVDDGRAIIISDTMEHCQSGTMLDTSVTPHPFSEGMSGSLYVRLAYQPPSNQTVTITSTSSSNTSPSSPLMFTTTNGTTCQVVTVTNPQDADATNLGATFTFHTDEIGGQAAVDQTIGVLVNDNDVPVTVTVVGTGGRVSGTAPSAGTASISNCRTASGTCTANYDANVSLTLTPTADADWQFGGWSGGAACTGSGPLIVSPTAALNCTATFLPRLTIMKAGIGTVTSPSGINCGAICEVFTSGATTVTAVESDVDWEFDHWSGDCSGTDLSTMVNMNQPRTCTATFTMIVP